MTDEPYLCDVCASDFRDWCNAGIKVAEDTFVCKDYSDGPSHCQIVYEATNE